MVVSVHHQVDAVLVEERLELVSQLQYAALRHARAVHVSVHQGHQPPRRAPAAITNTHARVGLALMRGIIMKRREAGGWRMTWVVYHSFSASSSAGGPSADSGALRPRLWVRIQAFLARLNSVK